MAHVWYPHICLRDPDLKLWHGSLGQSVIETLCWSLFSFTQQSFKEPAKNRHNFNILVHFKSHAVILPYIYIYVVLLYVAKCRNVSPSADVSVFTVNEVGGCVLVPSLWREVPKSQVHSPAKGSSRKKVYHEKGQAKTKKVPQKKTMENHTRSFSLLYCNILQSAHGLETSWHCISWPPASGRLPDGSGRPTSAIANKWLSECSVVAFFSRIYIWCFFIYLIFDLIYCIYVCFVWCNLLYFDICIFLFDIFWGSFPPGVHYVSL